MIVRIRDQNLLSVNGEPAGFVECAFECTTNTFSRPPCPRNPTLRMGVIPTCLCERVLRAVLSIHLGLEH